VAKEGEKGEEKCLEPLNVSSELLSVKKVRAISVEVKREGRNLKKGKPAHLINWRLQGDLNGVSERGENVPNEKRGRLTCAFSKKDCTSRKAGPSLKKAYAYTTHGLCNQSWKRNNVSPGRGRKEWR